MPGPFSACWLSEVCRRKYLLIKFWGWHFLVIQPAEWFHMCFLQSQNTLVMYRIVISLATWNSLASRVGKSYLNCMNNRQFLLGRKICYLWLLNIYFRSNNYDMRKRLHHHLMNFRFARFLPLTHTPPALLLLKNSSKQPSYLVTRTPRCTLHWPTCKSSPLDYVFSRHAPGEN